MPCELKMVAKLANKQRVRAVPTNQPRHDDILVVVDDGLVRARIPARGLRS